MNELIVRVEQGRIRGKFAYDYHGGKFCSFLGVPYGKAPVDELRFRAPKPAEPWSEDEVKDCTKDGAPCPALDMFFLYYVGKEEDCLNLNVHTKVLPTEDNSGPLKPVMVWIHGGGFVHGSNLNDLYGPDFLMTEDIVLVSINYRLGVLGFLALEDPELNVPGNAGLKDMVLALKWVQKNIQNFGGDPNNVTIFGESAGSASVHYLLLSKMAAGLFHKAILQSGSVLNPWARGQYNANDIAKQLNYSETDEAEILQKLQKESPKSLAKGTFSTEKVFTPNVVRPYGPIVEKPCKGEEAFLTEEPMEILKKGTFNKVPIIMGYNTKEGMLFEVVRKTRANIKLPKTLESEVPIFLTKDADKAREIAEKLKKFYYPTEDISEQTINQTYTLKGDNQFLHGIYKSILLQRDHTNIAEHPIYMYRMSLIGPLNFFKRFCDVKHIKTLFLCLFMSRMSHNHPNLKGIFQSLGNLVPEKPLEGVSHADDLGYLFRSFVTPKISQDSIEDKYIKRFVRLWTNFAQCGNPTPDPDDDILPKTTWQPVDSDALSGLDIGDELKQTVMPDQERFKFWDDLYQEYQD